jgi:heptosyltransferase-1
MHIAAAAGVPVVAMMGPTEVKRTGPYGDAKKVLVANVPCRPCFSRSCKLGTMECMKAISVESVLEASLKMLDNG